MGWPNLSSSVYFLCSVAQSRVTLCNPMDCSLLGSSVQGIPGKKYWSGLPFPPSRDLLHPGIEPTSWYVVLLNDPVQWDHLYSQVLRDVVIQQTKATYGENGKTLPLISSSFYNPNDSKFPQSSFLKINPCLVFFF